MPTKEGNGGHGPENYNPENGQYVKEGSSSTENNAEEGPELDYDIDIEKLSSMIDLEDEELSIEDFLDDESDEELSEADFFDDEEDETEEEWENILGMSDEEYELHKQGLKIPFFNNFNDVVNNIDSFFTPETINYVNELGKRIYSLSYGRVLINNTSIISGFAFLVLSKARYGKTHFKGISNEEYNRILSEQPQISGIIQNSNSESDCVEMIKKCSYVPTYRGMLEPIHKNIGIVMSYYRDNVKGAADTVLTGNGCYGYNAYCSMSKNYSVSYAGGQDTLLLRMLVPMENAKICFDSTKYEMDKINNVYQRYLPALKTKVRNILSNAGCNYNVVSAFVNSLDPSKDSQNRTLPLVLMGYDYIFCDGDQLDVLNPTKVLMNVERYRPYDD